MFMNYHCYHISSLKQWFNSCHYKKGQQINISQGRQATNFLAYSMEENPYSEADSRSAS